MAKKKNETIVSVIAVVVGAFILGKKMQQNKGGTDTVSGLEHVNEVPITREANRIAKKGNAYIYWDTIKYVYVVEDFCYLLLLLEQLALT